MKKRMLYKDIWMEIRRSFGRYCSILLIVALGVAFFSGLRATEADMRYTADHFGDESNLMDLRILSTMGLTQEDITALESLEGVSAVEAGFREDVLTVQQENEYVLQLLSAPERLNQIQVTEGRMPQTAQECLLDNRLKTAFGYEIGDTITVSSGSEVPLSQRLAETTYTIVGYGDSPLFIGMERGSSLIGSGQINGFCIVLPEVFLQDYFSEAYLTVTAAREQTVYTDLYKEAVEPVREAAESLGKEQCQARLEQLQMLYPGISQPPVWQITDRDGLINYSDYGDYAVRMGAIGKVFPAIFFLVAALVALTAITRMVEEQRVLIGTYKALGYSKLDAMKKYLLYALSATAVGSAAGVLVGEKLFPFVIMISFRIIYQPLRELVLPYDLHYSLLSVGLAVGSVLIAAVGACYKELAEQPAGLMRPVAPKPGKRVFLEWFSGLWKRLSFSQKNTFRNLFRYKKRLIMTVFGIGCCCGLLVVGFGLNDSIMKIASLQYENIQLYDAMAAVSGDLTEEGRKALENRLEEEEEILAFAPVMMKSVDVKSDQGVRTAYMVVCREPEDLESMLAFRDRVSKETYQLTDDGVILTEQMATALGVSKGETVSVSSGETTAQAVVLEITENYLMHYLYLTESCYEKYFGSEPQINTYWLNLSEEGVKQQSQIGKALMELPEVLTVSYVSNTRKTIDGMLDSLYIIVLVLVASASLLAFIVIYNLNHINISERKRELATIKLLGFYDTELAMYVYRENLCLTLMGAAAGLLIGTVLHGFVIDTIQVSQVMFGHKISVMSYCVSVLLTILFSAAVNGVMYFQLRRIDMIESLKSVE